jgi:hypothetical protein
MDRALRKRSLPPRMKAAKAKSSRNRVRLLPGEEI